VGEVASQDDHDGGDDHKEGHAQLERDARGVTSVFWCEVVAEERGWNEGTEPNGRRGDDGDDDDWEHHGDEEVDGKVRGVGPPRKEAAERQEGLEHEARDRPQRRSDGGEDGRQVDVDDERERADHLVVPDENLRDDHDSQSVRAFVVAAEVVVADPRSDPGLPGFGQEAEL